MSMQERRKHPRKNVNQPIKVIDQDRGELVGHLVDVSLEGFMLITPHAIEINRVFQVCLELPQEMGISPLPLGVECLWRELSGDRQTYWAGFQIIDISSASSQDLGRYIDDHL